MNPALPPGPWAVPAEVLGALLVVRSAAAVVRAPAVTQVARLGLASGWQVRRLLGRVADRTLPGRLVRAGALTSYMVEGVRLPPVYGVGPPALWPPWDGLSAVNQVVANNFLMRLLPLGPVRGYAVWSAYGCGLQVFWNDQCFKVLSFREGRGEENRFDEFMRLYRPSDGKIVVIAAGVRHMERLSDVAGRRAWPVRLTWDGALHHLPLARAFCRVGQYGPVPVTVSGLDEGRLD